MSVEQSKRSLGSSENGNEGAASAASSSSSRGPYKRKGGIPEWKRQELIDQARALKKKGLTNKQLQEHFGVKKDTIRRWLDPEYDERAKASQRARKESYQGTCVICGTPTSGSYGPNNVQTLCYEHKMQNRPPKPHLWPKERIIKAMQDWETIFGEPPSMVDWNSTQARKMGDFDRADYFDQNKDLWPWFSQVFRAFGSWNAGIEAAGFTPRPQYGTSETNSANRKRKAIPRKQINSSRERYWTRERIIQRMRDYYKQYGVPPTSSEWLQPCEIVNGYRIWPTTGSVQKEFGSWSNGMKVAGFKPRTKYTSKRDRKEEKRKRELKEKRDKVWTKEEIFEIINTWAAEHRIPPTRTEWTTIPDRPSARRATEIAGVRDWNNLIEAAGHLPRPKGVTAKSIRNLLPLPFGK